MEAWFRIGHLITVTTREVNKHIHTGHHKSPNPIHLLISLLFLLLGLSHLVRYKFSQFPQEQHNS